MTAELTGGIGRYTVRSRFARTGLTCPAPVAEQLHRLAAPYLVIEQGEAAPGEWQMIAGQEPSTAAVPESVTAQGEVAVEYAVDHQAKQLFHLAPVSEAWVVQSLLRATRAVHRSAASRAGVLLLHAGLVQLNGIGVALVGSSRAGKTSLIMASVLNGAGVMVCNDDVSLVAEHGEVTGVGWPRSISVRLDSMDLLFGRERSVAIQSELTHPANQTLLSLRESGVEPHGTALLYPWEYADLLGSKIGQHMKVDALVHLSLADDPAEAEFRPMAQAESAELLGNRLLDLPNKHLNIFGHQPAPGSAERTLAAVNSLPSFRFRYDFADVRRQADRLGEELASRL
ncbi:hypothetical protein M8C13_31425 [Crossiella sp. SN42]|uniref:hypothetical protein n=1 Tax=Crossiella sp. SN42 TaxID=2944808 RepID=UPI00207CD1E3|nr:hypothetical protein [Crossiella sp. SN42]MCO1580277.1 hypothetical protein [Crossiella sp. SN42]